MIIKNGKEVTSIYDRGKQVTAVYRYVAGAWRAVWEAIRSCFGAGYWSDEKPWSDEEPWKD